MTNNKQKGFTLIELLIATTVFSVILLAAAATLIQISRMYYKGVISSRTQGVARNAIDNVSRELQFSGGEFRGVQKVSDSPASYAVCFGETRFTFATKKQLNDNPSGDNQIRHVLWKDKVAEGKCHDEAEVADLSAPVPSEGGSELIEQYMRLKSFNVEQIKDDSNEPTGKYNVNIAVIYGDDDLLDPNADNPERCKGSIIGSQWCAFSELSTQVYRRVVE